MIRVGTTKAAKVSYVLETQGGGRREDGGLRFETQSVEVVARDWDVSDPEARRVAAEDQLGEGVNDDDWYAKHAMWFINAKDNAAVLIVFRPKVLA